MVTKLSMTVKPKHNRGNLMSCNKCKYKHITDFPEEYVSLLMSMETKREMIEQLMGFQQRHREERKNNPNCFILNDWTLDINRIAQGYLGMRMALPRHIRDQYDLFVEIQELIHEWRQCLMNGMSDEAGVYLAKAKGLQCCGEVCSDG